MVAIKDMEMPSDCYNCPFTKNERTNDYGSFCKCGILEDSETINLLKHSKHYNCPLVEIEERKVGKWIVKDNGNGGIYVECPFCGALAPCTEFADRIVWKYSNFCYDCGNELRGAENE